VSALAMTVLGIYDSLRLLVPFAFRPPSSRIGINRSTNQRSKSTFLIRNVSAGCCVV